METPVIREWSPPHDAPLPDLVALQAANPERYPGLIQSSGDTGWDVLFAFPLGVERYASGDDPARLFTHPALKTRPAKHFTTDRRTSGSALPFQGGWLCVFAYELGGIFEPTVGMRPDPAFPLAWLMRIPAAILHDRARQRWVLMAEAEHGDRVDALARDLAEACPPLPALPPPQSVREDDADVFLDGVARIQDWIRAGDVFQVNLSRGWQARFNAAVDPAALFSRLMHNNPAPFSALVRMDDWAIVSSSPERLVRLRYDGQIETRPIAGTHPRLDDAREDAAQRLRLHAHPKERAEHVMLVDLERNDLGRVCEPGSVTVPALMEIATYRHVHHIESTVRGQLRSDMTVGDTLQAVFPGGTITGCPKVRTMQIIHELERTPRRSYTGSLGYINRDGSFDLNILIRSFLLHGDRLDFRAGAGIVADSVADRELEETRAKARGLLRVLGFA